MSPRPRSRPARRRSRSRRTVDNDSSRPVTAQLATHDLRDAANKSVASRDPGCAARSRPGQTRSSIRTSRSRTPKLWDAENPQSVHVAVPPVAQGRTRGRPLRNAVSASAPSSLTRTRASSSMASMSSSTASAIITISVRWARRQHARAGAADRNSPGDGLQRHPHQPQPARAGVARSLRPHGLAGDGRIFRLLAQPKKPNDYHLFPDWHEQDLRSLVRRDRNHPCVVLWSIGNEIPEQGRRAEARGSDRV